MLCCDPGISVENPPLILWFAVWLEVLDIFYIGYEAAQLD